MTDLICIAKIVAAHGIRGQIKVKSYSENLSLYKEFTDNAGNIFNLKNIKPTSGDVFIASMDVITDRNQAETLVGKELFVGKEKLPALASDEFYYEDMIGRDVIIDGKKVGEVAAVFNFGAGDFFEVELLNGKTSSVHITSCEITDSFVTCAEGQMV